MGMMMNPSHMITIRTVAALLTIGIGSVLATALIGFDFPLADGDGGVGSPGLALALILGGAPIMTGIDVLRREIKDRRKAPHQS